MVALAAPTSSERRLIAEETTALMTSPGPKSRRDTSSLSRAPLMRGGARDTSASRAHEDAVADGRRASAQAGRSRRVRIGGRNMADRNRCNRRADNIDKNNTDYDGRRGRPHR